MTYEFAMALSVITGLILGFPIGISLADGKPLIAAFWVILLLAIFIGIVISSSSI